MQMARDLPMISRAPVHFNAKTWVDDHVGFQVYSLEFYLIVYSGGSQEKTGAWRPYNIHVIVCIYLQLSKENPAL